MSIDFRHEYTHVIIRSYVGEVDDRVLLMQRPGDKSYPWTWECAGGKVELGESHEEALARELREELDLQVTYAATTSLGSWRFVPPAVHRPLHLHYYRIEAPKGFVPKMLAGVGCGWFTLEEAEKLTLAPGNKMIRVLMQGGPR